MHPFSYELVRTFLADFNAFINRGNVVDLAVAVVIGGAFGKVVDAVVVFMMGSVLQPALKAASVDGIANWPAGAVPEVVAAPDIQAQLASAVTRLAAALDRCQL